MKRKGRRGRGRRKKRYIPEAPRGKAGEHALTPAEVEQLLTDVPKMSTSVLLGLAISTGIRREDIVAIKLTEVDLGNKKITFYESKKGRPHTVQVGGKLLEQLAHYIGMLPKGAECLFPRSTNPKKHISGRTAYNLLQRELERAGLRPRPFHALRSTCVKMCKHRGWSIEETMRLTNDTFRTIKEHYDVPSVDEMMKAATEKPIL